MTGLQFPGPAVFFQVMKKVNIKEKARLKIRKEAVQEAAIRHQPERIKVSCATPAESGSF